MRTAEIDPITKGLPSVGDTFIDTELGVGIIYSVDEDGFRYRGNSFDVRFLYSPKGFNPRGILVKSEHINGKKVSLYGDVKTLSDYNPLVEQFYQDREQFMSKVVIPRSRQIG